ncbi:MAG: hypothetical protein QOD98_2637 [Nocardioidaceae bacterium]|nr:hypothetical protein [Nocardioidaceae bacterium]
MKLRRTAPAVEVAAGEKVLAWAASESGPVAGTRSALYLPDGVRIPWEQVEAADWDLDSETLRVTEVGTWGEPRPAYSLALTEPGRLLQLVRERVTATVVIQRHVPIRGKRGVRVIARRATTGARELIWVFEYDEGIDPDDPFVEHAAQEGLAAARGEIGA